MFGVDTFDAAALGAQWRSQPAFPHVCLDGVFDPRALDGVMAVLDDEPVEHHQSDIFAFDATAPEPTTAAFGAIRDAFADAFAPLLSRVTARPVARVDMRAFAYRPGHYLLPHTDHQGTLGRVLAYALYLPSPEPPTGGELELYQCAPQSGGLGRPVHSTRFVPQPNRMVVFAVSDTSLHEVHEVRAGLRLSLAGWFYA